MRFALALICFASLALGGCATSSTSPPSSSPKPVERPAAAPASAATKPPASASAAAPAAGPTVADPVSQPSYRRVLLVQPDIQLHEVSAGGVVEKVDEWSEESARHAIKSLQQISQSSRIFELVQLTELPLGERSALEQHAALYALVAGSAYGARNSLHTVWRERAGEFDYTLGPGLAEVAHSTELDAAVFIVGTDYISTAGRKAAMVFGAVLGALAGVVIVPQSAPAFLSVGVVDLRSGKLQWFETTLRGGTDSLRSEAVVHGMMEALFKKYPGAQAAQTQPAASGKSSSAPDAAANGAR